MEYGSILALIGFTMLCAFVIGLVFRRLGIPQVVGFIIAGTALGSSFLNIVPLDLVKNLEFVSELALGLIGFEMGSHLHLDDLRRLGRSIAAILFCEAIGTFALVAVGVALLAGDIAVGLIFGALAAATAPAATVDVLEEYKAKGPLTTSILAVVGMDDALALLLFSVAVSLAEGLFGGQAPSLLHILELPFIEIGGALILGALLALPLALFYRRSACSHSDALIASVGVILVGAGLAQVLGFSLILTTMTLGLVVVNVEPCNADWTRATIERAGPVLYILFFALVGAHFEVQTLLVGGLTLTLAVLYVILRSAGKFGGAWIGGRLGRAQPEVRDNLGLALLSQAGVAIGLSLSIAHRFDAYGAEGEALGRLVINVITATTFVVQILGPIMVKRAIVRAGEVGKAGDEIEDLVAEDLGAALEPTSRR
ncbi:MAG: cation:proton antiporter [Anaerolineae bacterium]|nr:cation:proton antiporter [Anaerolineae bacterium]